MMAAAAAFTAASVTQAVEKAGAFAAGVARASIARSARDLASDGLLDPLAAIDGLDARDAAANRTRGLARDLAGLAHGDLALLFNAGHLADLDFLFLPHVRADRDPALDGFGHADLLADG